MTRPDPSLDANLTLDERVLGRSLVIQHSRLAGFRHHGAPTLWPALKAGSPLTLNAEQDNPHDRDAVAVYWRGRKLGYLPRGENLVAARLLARNRPLSARIRCLRADADLDRRLELDVVME